MPEYVHKKGIAYKNQFHVVFVLSTEGKYLSTELRLA